MTEPTIFPDDLVVGRTRNGKYKFAVVEHVAGIEDEDEDSSDSEFEDFRHIPLERGFVRVTWYPDGRSEILQDSQVQLVDRSCLARDVIRMRNGEQLGTAISTKVTCDVGVLGTSKTLKGINVSNLKSILPLSTEDQVSFGPWLGSIRNTLEMLVLRFSNGARAKLDVEKDGCEHLMDLYPHPSDEGGFSMDLFYPGQYLWGPAKAFTGIQWVSGPEIRFKPKTKYRVLVELIELYGVKVKWVSRAFSDRKPSDFMPKKEETEEKVKKEEADDLSSSVDPEPEAQDTTGNPFNEAEPPPSVIYKEDLKKFHHLNHFWHGHVCLGERVRYKLTEEDAEKLNKQKNKDMKKTKRLKLAKRMDQKFVRGTAHSATSLRKSSGSARSRRQQATHNDSATDTSSENDDSAYDEEDLEDFEEDSSSPAPSSGACGSVARDTGDIEVSVNSESDMNLSSPSGVRPTILGTLSCRVAGFELDVTMIQETVGVIVKRQFQCNIQNPDCAKETLDEIRSRFLVFLKTMMRKNRDLINTQSASCAAVMSQCPQAIRKFMMQQSSLSNQEILFEYTIGGKKTSGIIDGDGKKTEVEYSDQVDMDAAPDCEGTLVDTIDPINDFVLTSGPPSKRQAGLNVQYHAEQWLTVEVTRTHTKVDVQWQDGSIDRDIQSSKLFPAHHVDDNDFCPGDFVIDKRVSEEQGSYGIVLKADSKNRMTKIQWIREGRPSDIEEVSVYEVADHPDFRFRISDVIVRVGTAYSDVSADNIDISKQGIGELLRVTELGLLEVLWADGSISLVHPQDIIAFNDDNDSLFESSDEMEDFDSDASWVTASTEDGEGSLHEDASRTTLDSDASLTGDTGIPRPVKNGIDSLDVSHERGEGSHGHDQPEAHELHNDVTGSNEDLTVAHEDPTVAHNDPTGAHTDHDDITAAHEDPTVAHKDPTVDHDDVTMAHEDPILAHEGPNVAHEDPIVAPNHPAVANDAKNPMQELNAPDDVIHEPSSSHDVAHEHQDDVAMAHEHHVKVFSSHEPGQAQLTRDSELTEGGPHEQAHELHSDTHEPAHDMETSASTKSSQEAGEELVPDEPMQEDQPGVSHTAFSMVASVPSTHQFVKRWFQETSSKTFMKAVQRDLKMLRTSLCPGITVKAYEDRMDLLSVLIIGPDRTPYQDGIFVFDVYLPQDYPISPPSVHYVSYSPRLNPNLYETGRVCVSLLGTWSGKGSERWTKDSTLLQVLLSIQGLILNSEPYYNEAGYEGHRGTAEGMKNSRCYNEMVTLRLVQHMTSLIQNPPEAFMDEVTKFCAEHIPLLLKRVTGLLGDVEPEESAESAKDDRTQSADEHQDSNKNTIGYPLLPLSKGVMLSLNSRLHELEAAAKVMGYLE